MEDANAALRDLEAKWERLHAARASTAGVAGVDVLKFLQKEATEELLDAPRALGSNQGVGGVDPSAGASMHGRTDSAASMQHLNQKQDAAADSGGQLHLRWDRGVQVQSVGLVSVDAGLPTLWVGLNRLMEFYPRCQLARKESEPVAKGKAITCILCEVDSRPARVWTGHADGTVMLHAEGTWDAARYSSQMGVAIRALALDGRDNCWAGDDAGVIYMLQYDALSRGISNLRLRRVDVPPASAGLWQKATRSNPAAAAAAVAKAHSSNSPIGAPVLAMLGKAPVMLSSGSLDRNYLTLWNSQRCETVEHCLTQSFGPAHCLAAINWLEGPQPGSAASSDGSRPAAPGELAGWRLLSGHESGQLLLWQIHGLALRPQQRAIQLLSVILEPKQLSCIRYISCFKDFNMLVLADSSGTLGVLEAPTAANGAVSTAELPGAIPGAPPPMRWSPAQGIARIKAHRSGIICAASLGELLVTASNSTVKSWSAEQLRLEARGDGLMFTETSSVPTDAFTEHLISSSELELNELIGIGSDGKVYRGKWCNIDIAAKEYLAVDDGESERLASAGQEPTEAARNKAQMALLKEVGVLAKLTHPNLVRFCGVCLDPPLVVMEYYRNGSVYKILECARAAVQQGSTNKFVNYLSWQRRLDMLHDVASGMMYLHSRRYVHGDLRSPNLLVTENGRVKVGDFGFTKQLERRKETIKVSRIIHPRWAAPELLTNCELSAKSDVYSFGIIMYELLTFKIPFEECTKTEVAVHVAASQMRPAIPSFDKMPPNTGPTCLSNYIRLMQDCWHQDPNQRPEFSEVARRLRAMQRWNWAANALGLSYTAELHEDAPPPERIPEDVAADTADKAAAPIPQKEPSVQDLGARGKLMTFRPRLAETLLCSCPMVCVVAAGRAGRSSGAPHVVPLETAMLRYDVTCHVGQAFVELLLVVQYPNMWPDVPCVFFLPKTADTTITELEVRNEVRPSVQTIKVVPIEDFRKYGGKRTALGGGLDGPEDPTHKLDPNLFMQPIFNTAPGDRYVLRVKYFHPLQFDIQNRRYVLQLPTVVPQDCLPNNVSVKTVMEVSVAIDTAHAGDVDLTVNYPYKEVARALGSISIDVEPDGDTPWPLNADLLVQYSVWRDDITAVLQVEAPGPTSLDGLGTFVLSVMPPGPESSVCYPRDVVFVLDRSESMTGEPMLYAKAALLTGLLRLDPADRFAVMVFDHDQQWWRGYLMWATPGNIRDCMLWVNDVVSPCGTADMKTPLMQALRLLQSAPDISSGTRLPLVLLLTDGCVDNERDICQTANSLLHGMAEVPLITVEARKRAVEDDQLAGVVLDKPPAAAQQQQEKQVDATPQQPSSIHSTLSGQQPSSTVSGGQPPSSTAYSTSSTVKGGQPPSSTAYSTSSTVTGGQPPSSTAYSTSSTVTGGQPPSSTAYSTSSTVTGGQPPSSTAYSTSSTLWPLPSMAPTSTGYSSSSTGSNPLLPRIFTFGVGAHCNHYFLKRLAAIGRGMNEVAFRPHAIQASMEQMLAAAALPILSDLELHILGITGITLFPSPLPDVFVGQPLLVTGKFSGTWPDHITLVGTLPSGEVYHQEVLTMPPQLPRLGALDSIFAKGQLDQLVAEAWLLNNPPAMVEQILSLSLARNIPVTHTVAIEFEATPLHADQMRTKLGFAHEVRSLVGSDRSRVGLLSESALSAAWQKLARKDVSALLLAPAPTGIGVWGAVWVARQQRLEVFRDCTRGDALEVKLNSQVTCMTYDSDGRVWTGHKDGTVRVHSASWGSSCLVPRAIHSNVAVQKPLQQGTPVCSLAIDARGCCWCGLESGALHVLRPADTGSELLHTNTLARPPGRSSQPVHAITCYGQLVFSTGGGVSGAAIHTIRVWELRSQQGVSEQPVLERTCNAYGAATSLAIWSSSGAQHDMLRAASAGAAAASSSMPRSSAGGGLHAGSSSSSSSAGGGDSAEWVLVSGHKSGQVVLWQLLGTGPHRELHQLRPALANNLKDTCVVQLMVLQVPHLVPMLVVAHTSRSCSLYRGCQGTLSLYPLPDNDHVTGAQPLEHVVLGVHADALVAASCLGDVVVTASAGRVTVKTGSSLAADAALLGWNLGRSSAPVAVGVPVGTAGAAGGSSDAAWHQQVTVGQLVQPQMMVAPTAAAMLAMPPEQVGSGAVYSSKAVDSLVPGGEAAHKKQLLQDEADIQQQPSQSVTAQGRMQQEGINSTATQLFGLQLKRLVQLPWLAVHLQQVSYAVLLRGCAQQASSFTGHVATQVAAETAARSAAELSVQCSYLMLKPLPGMFGQVYALQARCNSTNRLRTLLQLPRSSLQQLRKSSSAGWQQLQQELVLASSLHHPHLLQVHEVFAGPEHLFLVLEECSAGRLLDYPALYQRQAAGHGRPGAPAAAAALSPEFARWFVQQVVFAVDYYHAVLAQQEGPLPTSSGLLVQCSLLKVVPNVPQPVVKVPTRLLCQGVPAAQTGAAGTGPHAAAAAGPSASFPGEQVVSCWEAPGQARAHNSSITREELLQLLQAADVWACGVLLVTLLGGSVDPNPADVVTSAAGSRDVDHAAFELPFDATSTGLQQLLIEMLAMNPSKRIPLLRLLQHTWFTTALPPSAKDMTTHFLARGRVGWQPLQEVATVLEAAASGPSGAVSLQQQLLLQQPIQPAASPSDKWLPARPEQLFGLQLQLKRLIRLSSQLAAADAQVQQAGSSVSYAVLQQLCAQQAFRLTGRVIQAMLHALRALTRCQRLQQQGRARIHGLKAVLLLRDACSRALLDCDSLLQLLRAVDSPARSSTGPQQLPYSTADMQAYLLCAVDSALTRLWRCSKAAAAVGRACYAAMAPKPPSNLLNLLRQPKAVPRPQLMAAVLGTAAVAQLLAGLGAQRIAEELCSTPQQLQGPRQQPSKPQSTVVWDVEQLQELLVQDGPPASRCCDKTGDSSSSSSNICLNSCQVFSGLYQLPACSADHAEQQQPAFERVQVVSLAPLFPADSSSALPDRRKQAREQLLADTALERARSDRFMKQLLCPICWGLVKQAVLCQGGGDWKYCRRCMEDWLATGKKTIPRTNTPFSGVLEPAPNANQDVEAWMQDVDKALTSSRQEVQQRATAQHSGRWQVASEQLHIQHAPEARSSDALDALLQQLQALQHQGHLSSSSSSSGGACVEQQSGQLLLLPFVPVLSICRSPALLVLPAPSHGTLADWISQRVRAIQHAPAPGGAAAGGFVSVWQAQLDWPRVLQLLAEVAAALLLLHQQQPACVHGEVHAGAVHLLQGLPTAAEVAQQEQQAAQPQGGGSTQQQQHGAGRLSQLSLSALMRRLAPINSCHPLLAAPEVVLAAGPAAPAADVYGFGLLMYQLASGWLPEQYRPGTDEQISSVLWCRQMLAQYHTTSPVAAVHAQRRLQQEQQQQGSAAGRSAAVRASSLLGTYSPYKQHLLLEWQLPRGYHMLMAACLDRVAPARPSMSQVVEVLRGINAREMERCPCAVGAAGAAPAAHPPQPQRAAVAAAAW